MAKTSNTPELDMDIILPLIQQRIEEFFEDEEEHVGDTWGETGLATSDYLKEAILKAFTAQKMNAVTWAQNGLISLDPSEGNYSPLALENAQKLVDNVIEEDQVYCSVYSFEEEIFIEWVAGIWRFCFSFEEDETFIQTIVGRTSTFDSYACGKDTVPYEKLKLYINQLSYYVNKINPNWKEQFISN